MGGWGNRWKPEDLNNIAADKIHVSQSKQAGLSLPATEDDLQIQCISSFKLAYPKYTKRILHIPNGGKRNMREAVKLKKMGVLPGASDILITIPKGRWHGMFAELKLGDNDLSHHQEAFIKEHENDYYCVVCWSVDAFMTEVNKYLSLET